MGNYIGFCIWKGKPARTSQGLGFPVSKDQDIISSAELSKARNLRVKPPESSDD